MTTPEFHDHFSAQAAAYARFRPRYPAQLFADLARIAPARDLVWDCATGNGQAAVGLARWFANVHATDASAEQIKAAEAAANVTYAVAPAEASGLPDRCADLVTVAQAAHWFAHADFYAETRRVLRPDGILALWAYGLMTIDPPTDAVVGRYYHDIVGADWPPERHYVESGYRTLPFPFADLPHPAWAMTAELSRDALLGYLRTWSATRRAAGRMGSVPIALIMDELVQAWPHPDEVRTVTWPLHVRIGRLG